MVKLLLIGRFAALMLCFLVMFGCNEGGSNTSATGQASSQANANTPPQIAGKPVLSARVAYEYRFAVTASDADGDALSLSASNLPAWLAFDPATGLLTGTPAAADIGTYSGITIAATDGHTSVKLAPFVITVGDSWAGNASLSWQPPLINTDGSSVVALAGHKIIFGLAPDELQESVFIDNPSITRYLIENLSPGTWYFSLVAVSMQGVESPKSGLVSKTIF